MTDHRIWDPFVRLFHWSVAVLFLANAMLTDPEGRLHETLGCAIGVALALRLVWGLVGPLPARFASFFPTPHGVAAQLTDLAGGRKTAHLGHSPLGAVMIFNLLLSLAGIVLTGYLMTTNAFWGVEWVEEAHETLVAWAGISVVAHVLAVIWESHRTGINLPRAMVTGVKHVPETVRLEP